MSLKHAILGFLSYKSLSGYDLKKAFDRSVQHFWPANQSQIYRTLAALNENGLVEQEIIEREHLDMKLYHITTAGRQELHHWLSKPLPVQDYREPFLIQVYFAGLLSDEEFTQLLQHEIQDIQARTDAYLAAYKTYQAGLRNHENPRAFFLSVLTLEYGIMSNLATLEWLKSAAERVKSGNYSFMDFTKDESIK